MRAAHALPWCARTDGGRPKGTEQCCRGAAEALRRRARGQKNAALACQSRSGMKERTLWTYLLAEKMHVLSLNMLQKLQDSISTIEKGTP
jgi:hypothetical protein